jgi:hypothetical protein
MSLINDALKRARQAQPLPAPAAASDPLLQPVLEPPRHSSHPVWVVPTMGAALVLIASIFLVLWWRNPSESSARTATPGKAVHQQVQATPAVTQPSSSRTPETPRTFAPANENATVPTENKQTITMINS